MKMKVYSMGPIKGSLRRTQIYQFKHKVNKQGMAKIDGFRTSLAGQKIDTQALLTESKKDQK